MRKLFLAAALFLSALTLANAQTTESSSGNSLLYKHFKVDLMAGYAIPGGSGAKGGITLSLEPKYNITNNIAVGLKGELAILAAGYADLNGQPTPSVDAKGVGSYLVTGEYTFGTSTARPFVGLGLGAYSFASATVTSGNANVGSTNAYSKFGFAPRVGVQISHFRIAVEYNIVGKYKYEGGEEAKNSYLGLKLGVTFGGGKK